MPSRCDRCGKYSRTLAWVDYQYVCYGACEEAASAELAAENEAATRRLAATGGDAT